MLKYKEIAQDLKSKISSGKYVPNEKLPNEREMGEKYGASRITVKKAVDLLVLEGLIVKRRGSGTFVKDMSDMEAMQIAMKKQLLGFTGTHVGKKVKSEIIKFKVIPAPEKISEKLKTEKNEFVYYIERVRYLNDEPYVIEYTYMPIYVIKGINEDVLRSSIYEYIENVLNLKIQSSHRNIRATLPTEKEKQHLKFKDDEIIPILEVEQIAFLSTGQIFEYSKSRHRGDKMEIKTIEVR